MSVIAIAIVASSYWKLDSNGNWASADGDQLLVSDIASDFSRAALAQRLIRFHTIHTKSKLGFGSMRGLCVMQRNGKTTIVGFTRGHWILGDFVAKEWRKSLAKIGIRDVSSLAKPDLRESGKTLESSEWRLKDGHALKLPVGWYWIDESLGFSPLDRPNGLTRVGWSSPLMVYDFSSKRKSSIDNWLVYKGFTKHLVTSGTEFNQSFAQDGFCIKIPDHVLFICSRNVTPGGRTAIKKLCDALVSSQ